MRNACTCERESLSAKVLNQPGICCAVKLILQRRHAKTKGQSNAIMVGSRDVCLLMIGTRHCGFYGRIAMPMARDHRTIPNHILPHNINEGLHQKLSKPLAI